MVSKSCKQLKQDACVEINVQSSESEAAQDHFHSLYKDNYQTLILSLRKNFGGGPPDPEDVAQQAFSKLIAHSKLHTIRDLKAFLWRTARNIYLNSLSKAKNESKYQIEVEQKYFSSTVDKNTPETVLLIQQEIVAINDVLANMPEKRRHAFILHKIDGLPIADVAKKLNITRTPTVKHILRAAADIQQHLDTLQRGQVK